MRLHSTDGGPFELGLVCDYFDDDEQIGINISLVDQQTPNNDAISFVLSNDAAFALKDKLAAMLEVE